MIPSGVEIYLALEPIDMRLSFDRLSGLAKEHIGYDVTHQRHRDALRPGPCRGVRRGSS